MNTTANTVNNAVMAKKIRIQRAAGEHMENVKEGFKKFWIAFTDTKIENPYGLTPEMQAKMYL
ncbi:MAG: hypothetical protein K5886_05620 [Lachnospiraceae bacterium]|nr:hypothetical protein [Lachnospiraceae bacterium]